VYSKIFEGSVDEVSNQAIDLHSLLKRWEKSHPLYSHDMIVKEERLYLTLIKNNQGKWQN